MFENKNVLKQKLQEFWQNELEEIRQNKIRVFALIFSFFIAVALMFSEDSGEKIDVSHSEKVEESAEITSKKNIDDDKNPNKKVISVKKAENKNDGEKIVAVIGANSEELYVGDPFQSSEEKPASVKQEVSKNENIPQQIPIIPPQAPKISVQSSELPPIPDMSADLPPIPSVTPVKLAENITPATEFVLTGTAINSDKKVAVVKKISASQGKNEREENMLLVVGDVLDGRKIVNITEDSIIFDDGNNIHSNYLDSNILISAEPDNSEIEDIPGNYQENLLSDENFSGTIDDLTPQTEIDHAEELSQKNNAPEPNNIEVGDSDLMLISETNSDFTKTAENIISADTNVVADDDSDAVNVSAESDFVAANQAQTFLAGDGSP